MCIPTRTRLTDNNEKPWFTAKLRQLRQAKEDAYRKRDVVLYKQAKYWFWFWSLKVLYSTFVKWCNIEPIRGAISHFISSTKMVLNSINSGSLACKEPLKGINLLFEQQGSYIAP